jgi:hypothetical protein
MSMETVTIPKAEYEQLKSAEAQIATLQQEINWLTEQIRLARKQRFGPSSEKSKTDDSCEQLILNLH